MKIALVYAATFLLSVTIACWFLTQPRMQPAPEPAKVSTYTHPPLPSPAQLLGDTATDTRRHAIMPCLDKRFDSSDRPQWQKEADFQKCKRDAGY